MHSGCELQSTLRVIQERKAVWFPSKSKIQIERLVVRKKKDCSNRVNVTVAKEYITGIYLMSVTLILKQQVRSL